MRSVCFNEPNLELIELAKRAADIAKRFATYEKCRKAVEELRNLIGRYDDDSKQQEAVQKLLDCITKKLVQSNQVKAELASKVLKENARAELTTANEKLARMDEILDDLASVLADFPEPETKAADLASVLADRLELKNIHANLTKAYNELNQKRTELAAKVLEENARVELAGIVKQIDKLKKVQHKLITLPQEISSMKTRLTQRCNCANSKEFPACIKCWKIYRGPVPEKFKKQPATELAAELTAELATEPDTEPATEPDTEPATELATEPDTEPATEPATELAAELDEYVCDVIAAF